MGYLIGFCYFAMWMISGAVATRKMADDFGDDVDFMTAAVGAGVGLLWPLMIFPFAIKWLATRETPAERRDRLAVERDTRVRAQARKIALLEREAGLR